MSNTAQETITIEGHGKYGPKANGSWYSCGQKSGLTPKSFIMGTTYDVIVYTSDKYAKYINSVVKVHNTTSSPEQGGVVGEAAQAASKPEPIKTSPQFKSGGFAGNSPETQQHILRSSIFKDVVSVIPQYAATYDDFKVKVIEVSNLIIDNIIEKSKVV